MVFNKEAKKNPPQNQTHLKVTASKTCTMDPPLYGFKTTHLYQSDMTSPPLQL